MFFCKKKHKVAFEILQPLKIKSSTNSIFSHGLSVWILQATPATVGINCYTSASIGGNLKVLGSSNFTENLKGCVSQSFNRSWAFLLQPILAFCISAIIVAIP